MISVLTIGSLYWSARDGVQQCTSSDVKSNSWKFRIVAELQRVNCNKIHFTAAWSFIKLFKSSFIKSICRESGAAKAFLDLTYAAAAAAPFWCQSLQKVFHICWGSGASKPFLDLTYAAAAEAAWCQSLQKVTLLFTNHLKRSLCCIQTI